MALTIPEKIRYVAEVENVKEVSLVANADLRYWRELIRNEEFSPYDDHGNAELLITSADLVWKGMRSREVSVSLKICANDRNEPDGFYLLHAFNSSRVFAWIERNVFHTPYYHANIAVKTEPYPSVRVSSGSEALIHLQVAERANSLSSSEWKWLGPVFLPQIKGARKTRKLFFARIEGSTETFSFDASKDILRFDHDGSHGIIRQLKESGIIGKEWQIRKKAFHGKSKTYDQN
jgi:hypothetical protein